MRHAQLVLLVVLMACADKESTSRSEHRYENKEEGYSIDQPDGWRKSIDRGSTRFAPSVGGKHTIVVRSAPRPREMIEGKSTTNEDLLAATEQVLQGMPGARLDGRSKIEDTELAGARFSLTFVPNGLHARYRRAHVVLLGHARVFHIMWTAPETESVDEEALKEMVSTLKEEV